MLVIQALQPQSDGHPHPVKATSQPGTHPMGAPFTAGSPGWGLKASPVWF